jgi:hypothetical protein
MMPIVGITVILVMFVVVAAVPIVVVVVVAMMGVTLGVNDVDTDKSHGYGGWRGAGRDDDATG